MTKLFQEKLQNSTQKY